MSPLQRDPKKDSAVVLLVAIGLFCVMAVAMMNYMPDDTYISFRYAENLSKGYGLTFNEREPPVEAFSNLLWILLCAFWHQLGVDLPAAAPILGTAIGCLTLVLLWGLLASRGIAPLHALLPLLLFATCGPFLMFTISGMEMPLFALLLVLSLVWLDRALATGQLLFYLLLAVTGVLLALTRPEGIVTFPVIAAAILWMRPAEKDAARFGRTRIRNVAIASVVFAALMAAYHAWRISYFGEVLPTPLLSKGGGGKSLLYAWQSNLRIYFVSHGYYYPPLGYYFGALIALALLGRRLSPSRPAFRQTEKVALVLVAVHLLIYFNFEDWMPGMRYQAALAGLILLPVAHVPNIFLNAKDVKAGLRTYAMVGVALVVLSTAVFMGLRVVARAEDQSHEQCLVAVGKWLKKVMPPGSVLAISDVGAIPYYSGLPTVDIHPESLTDIRIAKNGFSVDYVYSRRPSVFVIPSRGVFSAKFYPEHFKMGEDPRFGAYRFVGVSRFNWYNDRSYWIYLPTNFRELTDEEWDTFPQGLGSFVRIAR